MLVCKLSHYLFTVTKGCGLRVVEEDLTDFQNAHRLPPAAQEEIFRLAYRELCPDNLIHSLLIYDPHGRMLGAAESEVRGVSDALDFFPNIPTHVTLLDRTYTVNRVVVFKRTWLENNYVKPMKKYRPLKRIVKEDPSATLAGLFDRLRVHDPQQSIQSSGQSVGGSIAATIGRRKSENQGQQPPQQKREGLQTRFARLRNTVRSNQVQPPGLSQEELQALQQQQVMPEMPPSHIQMQMQPQMQMPMSMSMPPMGPPQQFPPQMMPMPHHHGQHQGMPMAGTASPILQQMPMIHQQQPHQQQQIPMQMHAPPPNVRHRSQAQRQSHRPQTPPDGPQDGNTLNNTMAPHLTPGANKGAPRGSNRRHGQGQHTTQAAQAVPQPRVAPVPAASPQPIQSQIPPPPLQSIPEQPLELEPEQDQLPEPQQQQQQQQQQRHARVARMPQQPVGPPMMQQPRMPPMPPMQPDPPTSGDDNGSVSPPPQPSGPATAAPMPVKFHKPSGSGMSTSSMSRGGAPSDNTSTTGSLQNSESIATASVTPIAKATPVGAYGFQTGQRVLLTNLQHQNMNGLRGIVDSFVANGRVNVRLSETKVVCVKPENLEAGAELLD